MHAACNSKFSGMQVPILHPFMVARLAFSGIVVDFGKNKHLKKAPFQGKKSTFLAKIAAISQTKSTFGAEKALSKHYFI